MLPNNFDQPEGAAIDNADNIYVADAAKDSIYKYNSFGQLLIKFGGEGDFVFNSPSAVAFFDKTLYVADTDNNRILRYILSTDLQ
jgi:sugar lactone lactonase YvrE